MRAGRCGLAVSVSALSLMTGTSDKSTAPLTLAP